ncbi:MAG TPA: MATE family efflux transporter [Burkholderiaceae bacterium]|nr:MATE family efflux transporter [Burkholderiaceae bacterium]
MEFKKESRALLRLASPIILSQIAQVLMGFVDTVMSGHAGAVEQAVVGLGVALWIPIFIGLMSVVQAVSPIIAHHFGAGDRDAVARSAREGVWLALLAGLMPLGLVPWAPELLMFAGVESGLAARAGVFLWGIGLGLPAAMVYRSLAFYSASINQTRPIMVLAFAGLSLNALLNWILIYGHFGFPAMGGAGCGWATGVGMWVTMIGLVAWTACAPAYRNYYVWKSWRLPTRRIQTQLLRLGLPMGGAGLAEVAAFSSVAVLVGRFGEVQIAAHQVALNFSALVFMFPMGLSTAIGIRVGHSLGAGDPHRARFVAWSGIGVGLIIATLVIGPIILLRHQVAALYSADAAVRALAANLLLFAALWQLFDATQVCALGALRGYKVTLMPMVLMLAAFWAIGVPAGTWLGYRGFVAGEPMQVYGFWVGLVIGLALVSLGLAIGLRKVADRAIRDLLGSGKLASRAD